MAASAARSAAGSPDISSATSNPSTMPSSREHVGEVALARVDGQGRAHPLGERAAHGVGLRDHDEARAGVASTTAVAMRPIGPAPVHQHVLAEDRERERRVDRVPERVEDRGDVLVDARPVVPHVGDRQHDVLGERAVAVDAQPVGVGAQVAAARRGSGGTARRSRAPRRTDDVARRERRRRCCRPRPRRPRTRARRRAAAGSSSRPTASHASMWRSVPQMPVLRTRIRTSLMPGTGSGTRSRLSPGPATVLTSASMAPLPRARAARLRSVVRRAGPRSSRRSDSPPRRCPRSRTARGRRARGTPAGRGTRRRPAGVPVIDEVAGLEGDLAAR